MNNHSRALQRFENILKITGPVARNTGLNVVTKYWMKALAKLTLLTNKGRQKSTVGDIADEWLRMFPKGINTLGEIRDNTAHAQVHANCPLVGSGDTHACFRMMEYDRALLKKIGGELTVIESRANPKVSGPCQVAIRKQGDKRADLIPAHLL